MQAEKSAPVAALTETNGREPELAWMGRRYELDVKYEHRPRRSRAYDNPPTDGPVLIVALTLLCHGRVQHARTRRVAAGRVWLDARGLCDATRVPPVLRNELEVALEVHVGLAEALARAVTAGSDVARYRRNLARQLYCDVCGTFHECAGLTVCDGCVDPATREARVAVRRAWKTICDDASTAVNNDVLDAIRADNAAIEALREVERAVLTFVAQQASMVLDAPEFYRLAAALVAARAASRAAALDLVNARATQKAYGDHEAARRAAFARIVASRLPDGLARLAADPALLAALVQAEVASATNTAPSAP